MFSMCSELTPRAPIPDTRIPQLMQPCHSPSKTVILQLTLRTPHEWNCNKLGAPRQCNIVINWGDPSSPIRYNVIYGQPLTCITVYFSLVTAKWHFVRITSAIRCLGSISRMSEDAEFWRLHNKYVHWNTCLLSSQFFYPSENVATK